MDFRQLDSFLMIAKLGNFSKAAKELYLTQPTISNHIKSLEDELGLSLFHRSSWQVTLTEEGQIFLLFAKELMEKRHEMIEAMSQSADRLKGKLVVHTSTIPETYLLPSVIATFRQVNPEVQFLIKHGDSHDIIQAIIDEQIEFGFCGTQIKNNKLEYLPLMQDDMVLIVAKNNPLSELSLKELANLPLILREEGSGHRELLVKGLQKQGLSLRDLNVAAYSDSTETIKKLVIENVGGAFVSRYAIERELEDGLLKVIEFPEVDFRRDFYFVHNKNAKLSQIELAFINLVKETWSQR